MVRAVSIPRDDMTNDRESIRLTLAELWTAELLVIAEAAAAGLDVRNAATQILARIDALETPERPASAGAGVRAAAQRPDELKARR